MKLIDNWKQFPKMFSVQAQAITLTLLSFWGIFPDDLKAVIPKEYLLPLACGLLILGIIGRVVKQPSVTDK